MCAALAPAAQLYALVYAINTLLYLIPIALGTWDDFSEPEVRLKSGCTLFGCCHVQWRGAPLPPCQGQGYCASRDCTWRALACVVLPGKEGKEGVRGHMRQTCCQFPR